MLLILLVVVCSWEGFFCRLCFEDEDFCCCCRDEEDEDEDDEYDESDEKYEQFAWAGLNTYKCQLYIFVKMLPPHSRVSKHSITALDSLSNPKTQCTQNGKKIV